MRRFLVYLCVILPFISCLTPDEKTSQWILNNIKTNDEDISSSEDTVKFQEDDSMSNFNPSVQTSPNLNSSQVRGNSCVTKDGFAGECVSYYICNSYNMLIDDGTDIIDVRYNPKCPHYLLVCCGINDIDQEEKESESSEDTTISSTYTSIPTNIPKEYPWASEPPMSAVPSYRPNIQAFSQDEATNNEKFMITKYNVTAKETRTCGWSNVDISPYKPNRPGMRPVNITSSLYGEFPFMVAVLLDSNSSVWSPNDYIGGGTLIHYRVVLTVAHKFHDSTLKLKVRAGEYDTQTIVEQFPHQERNVVNIIKHPDFFRPSLYNDVALLYLESAFRELPSIGIACLSPSFPEKTDDCYSMGWGRQIHDLSAYALTLKKIPLPLVEASQCQKLLRKTRLGPFFELHQSLTCAGGEGAIDTCAGDGGSPLVCSIESSGLNKRFVVVGLVVYGMKCGKHGEPGVYVNVPFLYDWIEMEMRNEQIQQSYKL